MKKGRRALDHAHYPIVKNVRLRTKFQAPDAVPKVEQRRAGIRLDSVLVPYLVQENRTSWLAHRLPSFCGDPNLRRFTLLAVEARVVAALHQGFESRGHRGPLAF